MVLILWLVLVGWNNTPATFIRFKRLLYSDSGMVNGRILYGLRWSALRWNDLSRTSKSDFGKFSRCFELSQWIGDHFRMYS